VFVYHERSERPGERMMFSPPSHDMEDGGMKLRYLVVDADGRLVLTPKAGIEALWQGRALAQQFGCTASNEIRLVSVLCNNRLVPHKIFLLRLPLTQGQFTKDNYLTLRVFTMPDCVTPREVVEHHTDGWPKDFYTQLAVALDVPRPMLNVPLGVGGPLMMAAALKVTPREALKYLQ
jgi:hypothetical protein